MRLLAVEPGADEAAVRAISIGPRGVSMRVCAVQDEDSRVCRVIIGSPGCATAQDGVRTPRPPRAGMRSQPRAARNAAAEFEGVDGDVAGRKASVQPSARIAT